MDHPVTKDQHPGVVLESEGLPAQRHSQDHRVAEAAPGQQIVPVKDHGELFSVQDDCLVALSSVHPHLDMRAVRRLPPWRAVMIARIGYKAGVVDRRALDELVREARLIGGTEDLRNRA